MRIEELRAAPSFSNVEPSSVDTDGSTNPFKHSTQAEVFIDSRIVTSGRNGGGLWLVLDKISVRISAGHRLLRVVTVIQ